jgi:Transcriptional regulator, AbiEi antitoxin/AbiEi antitoxin C-terminal domain
MPVAGGRAGFQGGGMEDQRSLTWRSQLQSQYGVVSRQQALEAGLTAKAIDWRLQSGRWRCLHHGVYATFTGVLPRQAQLWAAVLRAGPEAALSHETAAEIHGLTDETARMIHISVPMEQQPGRCHAIRGVVIHRSRNLVAEWQPPWQLPRTTVEDTVLDLIATAQTFDDAYGWISAATGRRLTTPDLIAKALAGRPRMRWRGWVTAALHDAADGVHSPLERHYVQGVERAHGLPVARRQARHRRGSGTRYLDNLYETYGLCVELDGSAAHPAEGRWRDTHRDNATLVQGPRTLRYGWPDVTAHRCRTAAQVAAVLRRQGWTGTLRRCGPDCTALHAPAGKLATT